MLKENRKTELTPVSESLRLNCDLLFGIAEELGISEAEKARVNSILHPNGDPLFLNASIDDMYWFNTEMERQIEVADIEFNGTSMVLPVRILSKDTTITVSVKEQSSAKAVEIKDWKLDRVERGIESDLSTFVSVFSSEEGRHHEWGIGSVITIDVSAYPESSEYDFHFEYTTEGAKKEWYDYLKVWEGHKNNWYDYLNVWENSVNFVRVK